MKNKFLLFLTICIFTIDAHCFETDAEISNQPVRSIILHSSWMYYKDEDGNTITKERISDIRSIILQYTITFSNYDGTELERAKFDYGKIPIYSGATPERPATAQYTYTFKGWMPELVAVTENAVYTADYDSIVNQYTVTFNNYDGTELQSSTLDYGIMPTYSGTTPERPATAQYTYTFKGWMPELVTVAENAVYTADYDSVVNQYTVTFNNYDGTELQSSTLDYGIMPTYSGATPERPATAQYTYTFKGWMPELVAVTENATYTADYDSVVNQYAIVFNNYDGTELQSGIFDYGAMPTYLGATPERPATAQYTYTFKGWMPELVAVIENAVYTADYDSVVNQSTNLNDIELNSAVYKILRDGKVLIIHGGNACDMNGNDVKY